MCVCLVNFITGQGEGAPLMIQVVLTLRAITGIWPEACLPPSHPSFLPLSFPPSGLKDETLDLPSYLIKIRSLEPQEAPCSPWVSYGLKEFHQKGQKKKLVFYPLIFGKTLNPKSRFCSFEIHVFCDLFVGKRSHLHIPKLWT